MPPIASKRVVRGLLLVAMLFSVSAAIFWLQVRDQHGVTSGPSVRTPAAKVDKLKVEPLVGRTSQDRFTSRRALLDPDFSLTARTIKQKMAGPAGSWTESEVLALGFYGLPVTEMWDIFASMPAKQAEPLVLVRCMFAECKLMAKALQGLTSNGYIADLPYSRDQLAYTGAFCGPLFERFGTAAFSQTEAPVVLDAACNLTTEHEFEGAAQERMIHAQVSNDEILDVIDGDYSHGTKTVAVWRALHEERLLQGLNWDDLKFERDERQLETLAALIAAKFMCHFPGACEPRSLLLFQLCTSKFWLDCQINSDLSQIARDSLTPREYRWWQDATVPAGKKKG